MAVQIDGSQGKVIATRGDYSGNVTIGGTLTYEDVTNIDAVGLITARSGIEIGASPGVGASISVDGNAIFSGVTTATTLRSSIVKIGTDTEGEPNADDLTVAGSGHAGITIRAGTSSQSAIYMSDATSGGGEYVGNIIYDHSDNHMRFATAETERIRITGIGSIGIGLAAPKTPLHIEGVEGRAQLTLGNTAAAASDGDFLAGIDFHIKDNNDGTGAVCSAIRTYADQNHTASAKGTAIAFHTTDDDTTVLDERLRIDQYGALLIGLTTPTYIAGDMRHEIKKNNSRTYTAPLMTGHSHLLLNNSDTTTNAFCGLGFRAGSGDGSIGFVYTGSANAADFVINTDGGSNGVERLRIMNDGRVGIKFTGNYTMNSSSTNLVIGDGGSGVGMTFWTAVGADNQTISFQSNESLSRAEGEISYGPSNTSTANDRHAMMFRTNSNERLRIASNGNVGIKVTDPQSNLHVYGPGDIRMGSGDTGVANIALQVEHADDYTGTHFMFEITDSACWTFNGSHIAHGGGGSSYGMNVTYIRAMAGREAGAADSGDTWRNGGHQVNSEVMTTGQIGLNPGAGSVSFATDDTPDGASSTRSLYKISFSAAGQGATTTWGKLQGVLTWASTSTNGIVKIKDKDGNVLWNSRP